LPGLLCFHFDDLATGRADELHDGGHSNASVWLKQNYFTWEREARAIPPSPPPLQGDRPSSAPHVSPGQNCTRGFGSSVPGGACHIVRSQAQPGNKTP
jgi:hypothetical protein